MHIDRTADLPLHAQVRQLLLTRIIDGRLQPGDKLPSEIELSRTLGVTRMTVRQAIADLARSGTVAARQGSGTYVLDTPVQFDIDIEPPQWDAVGRQPSDEAHQGAAIRSELLSIGSRPLTGEVARELRVTEALAVETVRYVDDLPAMIGTHWVRTSVDLDSIGPWDENSSGMSFLVDLVGRPMYYEWRAHSAVAADPVDASALDIAVGMPLMRRCGVNVDSQGTPVMYVDRRFRGDHMRFVIRRRQPLPDDGYSTP